MPLQVKSALNGTTNDDVPRRSSCFRPRKAPRRDSGRESHRFPWLTTRNVLARDVQLATKPRHPRDELIRTNERTKLLDIRSRWITPTTDNARNAPFDRRSSWQLSLFRAIYNWSLLGENLIADLMDEITITVTLKLRLKLKDFSESKLLRKYQ